MRKEGIIEPVPFSEWAAPIVPVMKQDGTVRICGDYKLTVNKVSKTDSYPIPQIEDLFARVAGGQKFTQLDIAHAYQQIPLQEESKMYVAINTHKGLFHYNRLPFGVSSAPAIFQWAMETLLKDWTKFLKGTKSGHLLVLSLSPKVLCSPPEHTDLSQH